MLCNVRNASALPITIQRTFQASRPWQFSSEMSINNYGDCIYFGAAYCYNLDEAPTSPQIPFPPDEVWCSLVKTFSGDEETSWIIYIAKHQDLYNADWIVHESSYNLTDPQVIDNLSTIGCDSLIGTPR